MAKSSNQKMKLLLVMKFLLENSDEAHPVSMNQLLSALEAQGIAAERKSVYDDIQVLQDFGMDIVKSRQGYFIGSRQFELPELKLLVDSVQSSKFITQRKTLALIRKIESLGSTYDAQLLRRQVYVRNRVKSMNESVYYHVDEISAAINRDSAIRFHYFEYTVQKERRLRKGGAYYEVSPYALIWDDENYYLLAWDHAAAMLRHYRVDRMADIEATAAPRQGKEAFAGVNMSGYSQRVFGMFMGKEETVRLRFCNHLASAVLDQFGRDILLVPDGEEHFIFQAQAVISPLFFAWLFEFGTEAELLSPPHVREEYFQRLRALLPE